MSRRRVRRLVSSVAVVSLLAGLTQAVQDGATAMPSGPVHSSPTASPTAPEPVSFSAG